MTGAAIQRHLRSTPSTSGAVNLRGSADCVVCIDVLSQRRPPVYSSANISSGFHLRTSAIKLLSTFHKSFDSTQFLFSKAHRAGIYGFEWIADFIISGLVRQNSEYFHSIGRRQRKRSGRIISGRQERRLLLMYDPHSQGYIEYRLPVSSEILDGHPGTSW